MTDRPIIFSAPMVRALLAGTKTQTRRAAWRSCRPRSELYGVNERMPTVWQRVRPGDRLWVREAVAYRPNRVDGLPDEYWYPADHEDFDRSTAEVVRSPIHMPRWASRLTLTVTAARIERLRDISEDDARAEGLTCENISDKARQRFDRMKPWPEFYRPLFALLWDSIHTPGAWEANPEVVALTFTVERRNIDAGVTG